MDERKIESEKKLSYLNKALIMLIDSIIGRDYINSLLLMFIFSLIGTIMRRGEITYAFFLIAIINLNTTLKGITASIKVKGPELGASFLLLIFLVYFYSNLGFFYLNSNFAADIENDIPDNYCLCLSFCFMTNFDAGIRARGGAADQMIRVSFERNTLLYAMRFFYDITYFLICIIIMIDLVFGIILGTFSEMREE
jgi:inositol 1,4,5-triphosphate receptor type 3